LEFFIRQAPDYFAGPLAIAVQWQLRRWIVAALPLPWKNRVNLLLWIATVWVAVSFVSGLPRIAEWIPYSPFLDWLRGLALMVSLVSLCAAGIEFAWRLLHRAAPAMDPGRRTLLKAVKSTAIAVPILAVARGAIFERKQIRLVEVDAEIPGLPEDLNGLKLVQLSDIHFGSFFPAEDLLRAIEMANETKAHIALVTGDLINLRKDPLDQCMSLLTRLRSDAGTFGCLGNHEVFAKCEHYTTVQGARLGMRFLRDEAVELKFGNTALRMVGVDYQRKRNPYLQKEKCRPEPGKINILLSHNPDVFPVAAAQGYDLTISGHTHGGQITFEILPDALNPAQFYTPYIYGKYVTDGRQVYVSRGLGTVGMPVRAGCPPEVSLIRLCAT